MAKPAFIYAFDNLGPDRFTELCGLLLASRYKGFLLGGVGADGGIDGEIAEFLGEWQPETIHPLLNEVIQPNKLVVFQFKHKTTARVGQAVARQQLLSLYTCRNNKSCELHSHLIQERKPNTYVLVTNVEVNSEYRQKFIEQCKQENPEIENYQIIGLDELETWITNEMQLRHLYFPTIFGEPRFNLQVKLDIDQVSIPKITQRIQLGTTGFTDCYDEIFFDCLQVSLLNIGTVPTHIDKIIFRIIVAGKVHDIPINNLNIDEVNTKFSTLIEVGQKQICNFRLRQVGQKEDINLFFQYLQNDKISEKDILFAELIVCDQIDNQYSVIISDELRNKIWG